MCAMAVSRRCCSIRWISSVSIARSWARCRARARRRHKLKASGAVRQIILPQRLLAQRRDKIAMRRAVGIGDARHQRHFALALDHGSIASIATARAALGQTELRLPPADQLEIDLSQELGIEQRAVAMDAMG